ncbi:MAG: glycosyltransferase family 8 protein [bacterium]|nr:glycosyltransferase family 8 protein [bacterium]
MEPISIKHSNLELLRRQTSFKDIIPVVLTPSNEFIPSFAVTVQSISAHADKDYLYHIYVFHKDTFDLERAMKIQHTLADNFCITFIDVTEFIKELPFVIPVCFQDRFPIEVYFRLLIPTLLDTHSKVIYLDTDLVVLTDIRNLYNIDLGECLIGGISEYITPAQREYVEALFNMPAKNYINDGVLLMNCDKLNEFHFMERYLNILAGGPPQTVEQDLINMVCKGQIHYLDTKWNLRWHMECHTLSGLEIPYIFHYLSQYKPWNTESLLFSKYYYYYAAKTIFSNDIGVNNSIS